MNKVPVIFCFDSRILLGAGVSILSMLDSAAVDTSYEIHIFHPGLEKQVRAKLQSLVAETRHSMAFHEILPERFSGMPKGRGSWTEIVYYRLLAAEVLPECDKAIYSDVDVFFHCDLMDVLNIDLTGYSWAGVAAEANTPETTMHQHFPENPNDLIFFSGFMVMNLDQMRNEGAINRYFETIFKFSDRLKFFDLDVLNLSTNAIFQLPFQYVTLEDVFESDNITHSADYRYLKSAYSIDELEYARDNPAIIHFAGRRGKPWQRLDMPVYYREVVLRLPPELRVGTFRDFRKRWFSVKGRRRYPKRSVDTRKMLLANKPLL